MGRRPKILVLGLDGVSLELVNRFIESGALPNFAELLASGTSAPLASTVPPMTFPAWTTFMTGANPANHGVVDFTMRRGYGVRFIGSQDRQVPTWFEHLERQGLTVGAAWFPATYPPLQLNGYHIAGWDSPVTARGDSSFVSPAELHRELAHRFGDIHLAFDTIDEFSDDEEWYHRTAAELPRRVTRRAEMAAWLLEHHPVDVAAFYFGEADTAAHHFWAFHDDRSPRHPQNPDPRLAETIRDVYQALDRAIGHLVRTAGPQAATVVLSDHGSGGSSDLGLHLNRWLNRAGLLQFSKPSSRHLRLNTHTLRHRMPRLVPRPLRRTLFRLAGGLGPALLESKTRFGGIDFHRTVAFSEELSYAPSIWFNLRGREPQGQLAGDDRATVIEQICAAAGEVVAPDGTPLINRVIPREAVYRGKWEHRLPDLFLELHRPGGYTPVCLPSSGRPGATVRRLDRAELLGRKGRSLPGCHTSRGILIVNGPDVEQGRVVEAAIVDVAPIITTLAERSPAPWFDGHRPEWMPEHGRNAPADNGPYPSAPKMPYTAAEEQVVADRLRRLGYLEE